MTISRFMLNWLDELASGKVSFQGAELLEIGPQDLSVPVPLLRKILQRRIEAGTNPLLRKILQRRIEAETNSVLQKMHVDGSFQSDAQKTFYKSLGVAAYTSIDLSDPKADIKHDMNLPLTTALQYDLVTNFGTAEHVFNVFQFFETVHKLLKVGGTALHVLPACGDVNHGFYNFHPIFFHRLAKANNYDVVDYSYVDNIAYKTFGAELDVDIEYRADHINKETFGLYEDVRISSYKRFLENLDSKETKVCEKNHYFTVFDYSFVALTKTSDRPFLQPQQ